MSDGGVGNDDAQSPRTTFTVGAKHEQSAAAASGDWARFPTAVLIIGLSVLALLIRVSLARQSGLWRDEGLFLFVARVDTWSAMLEFLRFNESHPPLFYAVMRAWMSIAGSSDAAAQVIPVILGVALVPAIYSAGASLFSRRAGLLAATLAALSPALAEHAALVRPYSLLPLLALLSSYTLVRGFQHGGRRVWLTHIVSTLAILYTHNWGILVLGGQWVAAVCVLLQKSARPGTAIVRQWIVSQLMIAVGYAPWISTLLYQSRHAGHAPPSIDGLAEYFQFVADGLRRFFEATLVGYMPVDDRAILAAATRDFAMLLFAFAAVAVVVRFLGPRRRVDSASTQLSPSEPAADGLELYGLPLIILVAVPVSAWLAALVLSPRSNLLLTSCMVTLAPMFILAFSVWLTRHRTGLLAGGLLAAAAMLVAKNGASLVALSRGSRSNAREIANAVAVQTSESDLLIIAPEWLASSFNLYYTPDIDQINFPHFGREGAISHSGVRARSSDPAALLRVYQHIRRAREAGRRVWLITERDLVVDMSPEEIATGLKSPSYGFVGTVRANQIRTELVSVYGPPDTSVTARTPPTRFEHFRAYLFTVPGGQQ